MCVCVCPQVCTAWGTHTPVIPCLEVQGSCWNQGTKQGCPLGCWGFPACGSKLPLTSCHLHTYCCSQSVSVIKKYSVKNTAWRRGKRAYKENKHIFVCSENGKCRIKGICMKINVTDELEAGLFFKSKNWRSKGMHCAPLIYQLLEYPYFLHLFSCIFLPWLLTASS